MDAIDRQIVYLLRAHGRLSHERIAQVIHLSRPAVYERVKRLEAAGVLRGYQALVDWGAIGFPLTALVWVRAEAETRGAGLRHALFARGTDEAFVEECHRLTGEWPLVLTVRAASSLALEVLIDRVQEFLGWQHLQVTLILSTLSADQLLASPGAEDARPAWGQERRSS